MQQKQAVKMTVNLPVETFDALREMAATRGTTMTEVLRRAVLLDKYLSNARVGGARILVQNPDGTITELVFF